MARAIVFVNDSVADWTLSRFGGIVVPAGSDLDVTAVVPDNELIREIQNGLASEFDADHYLRVNGVDLSAAESAGYGSPNQAGGYAILNADATVSDAQHGDRSGDTLHADATQALGGFMSSADKTKLDGLSGIFGANYQKAESLGRSTTTSTTFQNKATLTTGALTGTYLITWHAVVDQNSIADAVQVQLYNNTDTAVVGVIQEHEPKDPNNRVSVGGFAEVVFTGSAKSFIIQYRQQRGGTAGIEDARIMLWRVA